MRSTDDGWRRRIGNDNDLGFGLQWFVLLNLSFRDTRGRLTSRRHHGLALGKLFYRIGNRVQVIPNLNEKCDHAADQTGNQRPHDGSQHQTENGS